jgi:hypothetical protein
MTSPSLRHILAVDVALLVLLALSPLLAALPLGALALAVASAKAGLVAYVW